MEIGRIDHFVLMVQSIEKVCEFYSRVLGMKVVTFGDNRKALQFGGQKINLHQVGKEFKPKPLNPTIGSGDICFVTEIPLEEVIKHVKSCGTEITEGPVTKTGARGPIRSIYIHDPDGNLVEIANYLA